jgi:hypothetical protein
MPGSPAFQPKSLKPDAAPADAIEPRRNQRGWMRLSRHGGIMLTDEQLAVLRDIDNAVAFDDDSSVIDLVLEGYVQKDGDLYELTPKGEKAVLDNGVSAPDA